MTIHQYVIQSTKLPRLSTVITISHCHFKTAYFGHTTKYKSNINSKIYKLEQKRNILLSKLEFDLIFLTN